MLKLCYKNNDKKTDEYYFDLQSQKVYKICLSTYYAKQNTRGIPFVFISSGILAILLEQVSQRVLLPKNGRMLLLFHRNFHYVFLYILILFYDMGHQP